LKGNLPFTGFPLWVVLLAALGLAASGLVLRAMPRRREATS
jgi:hypothetical protein